MLIIRRLKTKLAACLASALLVFVASCDFHLGPPPAPATLAVCPSDQDQNTSGLIGVLGGTVSLGGTSVVLPLGALLTNTSIELDIPASQYMEIGVTANGGHFYFEDRPRAVSDVLREMIVQDLATSAVPGHSELLI